METASEHKTPWQRVFAKFGMSQRALGKALGGDGAKINKALKDDDGFINGKDQAKLIDLAGELGVELTPDDLVPSPGGLSDAEKSSIPRALVPLSLIHI